MNACEECLLAHSSFAPFTCQLIAEKLGDSDLEEDVKLEICSFLVSCFSCFYFCFFLFSFFFVLPGDVRWHGLHQHRLLRLNVL